MKLPEAVRANDGSKYFTPSFGPTTFHFRGSCVCNNTIPTTTTPTAAAQLTPAFHLIFGPARRCKMYSQTARKGVITCAQYITERRSGFFISNPSTRISASPLNNKIRLIANSPYPTEAARLFGRFHAFLM